MSGNSKPPTTATPAPSSTAPKHLDRVGAAGLAWEDAQGRGHTAAPGSLRDDIPETSRPWLLAKGYITDETPAPGAPVDKGAADGNH